MIFIWKFYCPSTRVLKHPPGLGNVGGAIFLERLRNALEYLFIYFLWKQFSHALSKNQSNTDTAPRRTEFGYELNVNMSNGTRGDMEHGSVSKTRNENRCQRSRHSTGPGWMMAAMTAAILFLTALVAIKMYSGLQRSPLTCYQCNWTASSDADTCRIDQRLLSDAGVRTCAADELYCGVLRIVVAFNRSNGVQQLEYAVIRDCFTEYPLPSVVRIGHVNHTFYGTNAGNTYVGVIDPQVNLTVMGHQCSGSHLCNHDVLDQVDSFLEWEPVEQANMAALEI